MATITHFIKRTKGYDRSEQTLEDTWQCNVETANDQDAAITAIEAKPVPTGHVIGSVSASHMQRNPYWFEVRISYRKSTAGGGVDDPLDRPSILSASYEEWTEAYDQDHSDTPKKVLNSAKQPFDTLPQRKAGHLVLQITKNHATYAAVFYDSIKFTTNLAAVTIKGTTYAARTLLFMPPTSQEVYEQIGAVTHHYFAVTFRLAADAGEHQQIVADRGYKEFVGAEWRPIINPVTMSPTDEPWPLNGTGGAKAAGADPEELTFIPYPAANWGIDFD